MPLWFWSNRGFWKLGSPGLPKFPFADSAMNASTDYSASHGEFQLLEVSLWEEDT